jgi:hypothetical protein
MSDNSPPRIADSDPRNNRVRAWEIAVNPNDFTKLQRKFLVDRGIEYYRVGDEFHEGDLLEDVSQFIGESLDRPREEEIIGKAKEGRIPYVNQPGRLVLVMALASILVRRHKAIVGDSRKPRIHRHIRELYLYHINAASYTSEDRDLIRLALGTVAYQRQQEDELGPPVGQPIEGITKLPELDNEVVFKIPLAHANRQCEARAGNELSGAMQSLVKGPYVFVPVDDMWEKYAENHFRGRGGVPAQLEYAIENTVNDNALDTYQEALSGVNLRIDELARAGKDDLLFKQRRYPPKLKAILMAVEAADSSKAKLGRPMTAKEIYTVVEEYGIQTDIDWVKGVIKGFSNPQGIGAVLSNNAGEDGDRHVSVIVHETKANEYVLEYKTGNSKKIDVTEIEDLLALPCMKNLHESLLKSKPVRWELYSFVRYIFEVDAQIGVEEIKKWFSQYPWYRSEVTDYQVRYEEQRLTQTGDRPLPISCNCDNRNWSDHCIGKENCEYSLYGSVELKPDVYDRAGN